MFQTLSKQWNLFRHSEPGHRFQDFHDRRKTKRGTHAGKGKLFMIGGGGIAILGLVLLPLPGPGSIVLAGGLMLLASESLTIARFLDWADKKRERLMFKTRSTCKKMGAVKCSLLGAGSGVLLLTGGIALWFWLT